MYSALELTNRLRTEAGRVVESGLPLEVFPQRVQEIIFNLAAYENFNIEYSASIVLSAVAAAIGNACQIQIKGNWKTSPSIYMMLVGRPGLGKTPPLSFLYRPIHEQDDRMFEQYLQECDEYERAIAAAGKNKEADDLLLKKPQLVTTVISDFTPEALMHVHQHNLRGVAVEVDEILALFNSVKRYNSKNNLIEDLLSTYSGRPLKSVRKSEARPILIRQPCINVIGSVQTNLLSEVFRNEYKANGLLDRFLFVYPKDQRISKWQRTDHSNSRPDTMGQWRTILNRILNLPCPMGEKGNSVCSMVLNMAEDAEACFYDWYNGIIDTVNAVRNDAEVDSRKTKLDGNAARLSLIFQILKWAGRRRRRYALYRTRFRQGGYTNDRLLRGYLSTHTGEHRFRRYRRQQRGVAVAARRYIYGRRSRHCRQESGVVAPHGLLCVRQTEPGAEPRFREVASRHLPQEIFDCILHYCTFIGE